MEVSKNDWKLYREHIGIWQEAYIQKLIDGYVLSLSDNSRSAAERFGELENIKRK